MKHIVFVLALACASVFANGDKKPPVAPPPVVTPPAGDDSGLYFTRTDKGDHAVVGALLGLAGRLQFRESRWYAMAVPVGVSAAKEILDATQRGNHFSGRDLLAGAAGGVLGMWAGDGLIYLTRDNGTTRVAWATTF
jgi:hypothetical protein